jgi:hypothetical protein
VSLDKDFQASREKTRLEAKVVVHRSVEVLLNVGQDSAGHIKSGVQGLMYGVSEGLFGVLKKPYEGMCCAWGGDDNAHLM